MTVVNSS